jgi:hypothetical protein
MNKKILSKLKMEKPEYYDATDNKTVVIQKPEMEKTLKKSYWRGFQLGSLMGTFGIGASSLFALVTAQDFNVFLGIDGHTWKAIFTLLFIGSFVIFFILLILIFSSLWKGNFKETETLNRFFDEERKI